MTSVLVNTTMLKKIWFLFCVFGFVFSYAQEIPPRPNSYVSDYVGNVLSAGDIQQLEYKLRAYNDSTSTDFVIVIQKSILPYEASDYALKIGRDWKLGQKGKNNGIVLLWIPEDRKIAIQTGNGIEGFLPDMIANRIIKEVIAPNFKQGLYYQGLDQAINAIIQYGKGEYKAEPREEEEISTTTILIFLFLIILIIWFINRGGGGAGGRLGQDNQWPYDTYSGWGRQSGRWSGGWIGGGGFGGGGFGGGDSGGGFGGFGGGGGFSGGGASGDY
ncbi:MAG: TPM domain-containing protein [Leadbetterella sp.]